jgi:hypothetical protein
MRNNKHQRLNSLRFACYEKRAPRLALLIRARSQLEKMALQPNSKRARHLEGVVSSKLHYRSSYHHELAIAPLWKQLGIPMASVCFVISRCRFIDHCFRTSQIENWLNGLLHI